MSIAAKISSTEIRAQIISAYVDQYFEVALVDSSTTYIPGTTVDATFMASECVEGTGGYYRQIIGYTNADLSSYSDLGISLLRKAAVFEHDNSTNLIEFTDVVLLRGSGNVLTLGAATATPTNAVDGTYTSLPTATLGSGTQALLDLVVSGSGTNFAVTVSYPGYNYAIADQLTILEADLVSAGVCGVGDGNLNIPVATVTTGGNSIYSVSPTNARTTIAGGNQAVIYFDVKHFGFFN
jgi:hypothetical protein